MWKSVVAPTIAVSLLWMGVSSVSTYYMNRLYESHLRVLSEDVSTIESAWAMRRDIWKLQVALLETEHGNSPESRNEIASRESSFQKYLADAEQTSLTPDEIRLVGLIREQFGRYQQYIHERIGAQAGVSLPPVPSEQRDLATQLATAVATSCRELSEVNDRLIDDQAAQNMRLNSLITAYRTGFMVLAPLVGLLLGVWVARRLNRSISQISVTLQDATGKLDRDLGSVAVGASDDLPSLQRRVQIVADRIRKVVEELDDARQRAVQSERLAAVGELAAGVAHEIRNPLTSVKLLIQTASQKPQNQGLNEMQFAVILQEVSRMESMVQGLLDFARPPRLRVVVHDLRQTLRRALNLIEPRAQHQNVRIVEELPGASVQVNADPEQLHQVFVNLGLNGLDAMPHGGTLTISMAVANAVCHVAIRDTGPGIPPQLLDRVFEPFVTSKQRGTGLGLAICRRIIQEHRGTLLASNLEHGGAVLEFELQLYQGPAPQQDAPLETTDSEARTLPAPVEVLMRGN